MSDRIELDRIRERRLARAAATRVGANPGAPAMVGRVVSPASAIAAKKFLLVKPVAVLGAECEGCSPALTVGSATVPVLLLGPRLPATGDDLVCRFVDHRWVAERSGVPAPATPGPIGTNCTCPAPYTMDFTSNRPDFVVSTTLQYLAYPPGWTSTTFATSDNRWFSQQADPRGLYYTLYCYFNQYTLSLYRPASPGVQPNLSPVISWAIGRGGSTCDPWALHNGSTAVVGGGQFDIVPSSTQVPA